MLGKNKNGFKCAVCHRNLTFKNLGKSLPCSHTFCIRCQENNRGEDLMQDADTLCPVCHSMADLSPKNSEKTIPSKDKKKHDFHLLLKCALCQQNLSYNDHPKSLPCLHTFCNRCLTNNGGKDFIQDDGILCPVCHSKANLSSGYSNITDNLELDNIIEKLLRVRHLQEGEPCAMCAEESDNAILKSSNNWCRDCEKFLCDSCLVPHGRYRPKDKIIDVSQVNNFGKVSDFILPPKCSRHEKKIKMYCTRCEICLCSSCLVEHCSVGMGKCVPTSIEKDSPDKKPQGLNLLEKMSSRRDEELKQIDEMKLEISELEKQYSEKSVEIWEHVEETVKQLKENARTFLAEMEALTKTEVGDLEKLIQLKEDHVKEIDIIDLNLGQLLQSFDTVDILSNYSRLESKCVKTLKKPNNNVVSHVLSMQYNRWYLDILTNIKNNVSLASCWKDFKNKQGASFPPHLSVDNFHQSRYPSYGRGACDSYARAYQLSRGPRRDDYNYDYRRN